MAVSGGNSPIALFKALSQKSINWSAVSITLVDERWVDDQHPDSNAKLVKEHLLINLAVDAHFVPLFNGADSPFAAENDINNVLSQLAPPFDVIVLGMGEDGHTASFFPNAAELTDALDIHSQRFCCAIQPPAAAHARITLTLPVLLNCPSIYLLVTGKNKLPVLQKALEILPDANDTAHGFAELPLRAVLHRAKPKVQIYYAD